jgi:high-affinity K+ transport system ATPase subunit B
MLFYRVGTYFEHRAVERSRSQIMEAVDLRPETVNLLEGDEVQVIPAAEAMADDLLLVRPGDRIPLDGTVVRGESRIDTAPITGEPVPVHVEPGSEVISGDAAAALTSKQVDQYPGEFLKQLISLSESILIIEELHPAEVHVHHVRDSAFTDYLILYGITEFKEISHARKAGQKIEIITFLYAVLQTHLKVASVLFTDALKEVAAEQADTQKTSYGEHRKK